MDKSRMITLEASAYKLDSLDQHIPDGEAIREIYCNVKSITRSEWGTAAQAGRKALYCVTIWADEYEGEPVAILDGNRYSIYRTYLPNSEEIELYLEQKVGV